MDALSSAVPLKTDADLRFTLIASSLYCRPGSCAHNPLLLTAGFAHGRPLIPGWETRRWTW